jgi:hypothetical protein
MQLLNVKLPQRAKVAEDEVIAEGEAQKENGICGSI